ncbi:MAG: VacB/RNase II family 3'-5' exoribonuclease [Planctomycetota bacterium]
MPDRYTRRILDHVSDRRYEPITLDQLARNLQVPEDQRELFNTNAQRLLDAGQLVLGGNDTLGLPPPGKEMIGIFHGNQRGFGFLIPDEATAHGDLFIPAHHTGDALHSDRVRAKVIRDPRGKSSQSGYIGKVVEVLERADRPFVGTLLKKGPRWLVDIDGKGMPEPVLVRDAEAKNARPGQKVVVEVLKYPGEGGAELAEGVITEVLGDAGEPDVETLSVMRAFGLDVKFSDAVLREARAAAKKMESSGDEGRLDLTDTLIVTIDPPDAKDFDDAISLKKLDGKGGGQWELGVHIADVAHFVEPGSELDQEAYARGNSTYLPRKVIPMLPEVLSNGVCSLQPGVKRFAKSVFITYDKDGRPIDAYFAKTVINSAKRFTYIEAQALIDDNIREAIKHAKGEPKYPREVIALLKDMDTLARTIRQRRLDDGMIVLGLPDVELVFDETGRVIDAQPEDDAFTHTIIEMFMVEANEAAARLFDGLDIPMVRRTHPDPDAHDLGDLKSFARVAGFNIPSRPSRHELQALLDSVRGKPAQHAVHLAVLRTLSKAEYSPVLVGHFALASEHYTHFTSPIRRYPDFVVHRAINAILEAQGPAGPDGRPKKKPRKSELLKALDHDARIPDEERLTEIGRHCSQTERNSESAERELRKTLVLELLATRLGDDFDATVTGVTGQGAFLQLNHFLVDGFVSINDLPGGRNDRYRLNRTTGALVAQRSGATITIGDRFIARIAKVDLARREMELVIVGRPGETPGSPGKSGKPRNLQQGRSKGKKHNNGKPDDAPSGGKKRRNRSNNLSKKAKITSRKRQAKDGSAKKTKKKRR